MSTIGWRTAESTKVLPKPFPGLHTPPQRSVRCHALTFKPLVSVVFVTWKGTFWICRVPATIKLIIIKTKLSFQWSSSSHTNCKCSQKPKVPHQHQQCGQCDCNKGTQHFHNFILSVTYHCWSWFRTPPVGSWRWYQTWSPLLPLPSVICYLQSWGNYASHRTRQHKQQCITHNTPAKGNWNDLYQ